MLFRSAHAGNISSRRIRVAACDWCASRNIVSVILTGFFVISAIVFSIYSIASKTPAAIALPITPATLGPIACISR